MFVKKLICLASFIVVLSLVGNVQAAEVDWTDSTGDHLWSTPANWTNDTLPTSADDTRIRMVPGPTVANEGAISNIIRVGSGNSTGDLTIDGGTLTTTGSLWIANDGGSTGTVYMISGTINASSLNVARRGLGTLNMTGGTIIANNFRIGQTSTATGHVNLHGGIITANNFVMRDGSSVGTMDVKAGTMLIDGNAVSTVQGFIDNGWITAYGGDGTLHLDYDVTNEGQTTLKAVHNLNPNPADGSTVVAGEVELSWTLPDPCVPGQPVSVDVYFTDNLQLLEWFTDPAAIQVVSKQNVTSVVVQTQPKTWYYWAVDAFLGGDDPNNNPVFGPIFSFGADNIPPKVDAGSDVVTWLEAGTRTGNLDATVTDDDAYTVQWTVVSQPNAGAAVIETPTAEDTSITLTALGEYVLQLEASDGEYTGSDTVTIHVYNDSCEAAQSLPDYVPFPGDVNGDCIFDQLDLDILNEDWLKDNSLTEEWFKID